jgi:hypothetical protein
MHSHAHSLTTAPYTLLKSQCCLAMHHSCPHPSTRSHHPPRAQISLVPPFACKVALAMTPRARASRGQVIPTLARSLTSKRARGSARNHQGVSRSSGTTHQRVYGRVFASHRTFQRGLPAHKEAITPLASRASHSLHASVPQRHHHRHLQHRLVWQVQRHVW